MYAVLMNYAMARTSEVSCYALDTDSASLTGELDSTGDATVYDQVLLGHLHLAGGDSSVTMRAARDQHALPVSLRSIRLVPMTVADAKVRQQQPNGNAPRLVQPDRDGGFQLLVNACEIYGEGPLFEQQQESLAFWTHQDGRATWTLDVPKPGRYFVFLEYACGAQFCRNLIHAQLRRRASVPQDLGHRFVEQLSVAICRYVPPGGWCEAVDVPLRR